MYVSNVPHRQSSVGASSSPGPPPRGQLHRWPCCNRHRSLQTVQSSTLQMVGEWPSPANYTTYKDPQQQEPWESCTYNRKFPMQLAEVWLVQATHNLKQQRWQSGLSMHISHNVCREAQGTSANSQCRYIWFSYKGKKFRHKSVVATVVKVIRHAELVKLDPSLDDRAHRENTW